MTKSTQESAFISEETKTQVDAYVRRHGVKKAYLREEALQHHLQALREIPEDLVIPSRLVLTDESMVQVAEQLASDSQPTKALRSLFCD